MTSLSRCVFQVPGFARAELPSFRRKAAEFVAGSLDKENFKSVHVPMGIYEQRDGRFMVRVRIGAGVALPGQIRAVAAVARRHGPVHVTTRQDLQLHDVPADALADVCEALLAANLSSRGGGGNTVRNVTCSPRAGVDCEEAFDVRPYAVAASEFLLGVPRAFALPRKFKVAFSGSAADDAHAAATDLGFIAGVREGRKGFRAYAGGGLGAHPRTGIVIEEWIPADSALYAAEAVRRVFDRHGDRTNRRKARLRHVLDRFGEAKFRAAYLEAKTALAREGLPAPAVEPREFPEPWREELAGDARRLGRANPMVLAERREGFHTVRINPRDGLLEPEALERIAGLAEKNGEGLVRTTQQQELLICGVPGGRVQRVLDSLRDLGSAVFDERRPAVVACTGAGTCRLGMCLSRGLADAVRRRFAGRSGLPAIRISGCPNSCANHQLAPLGFSGRFRSVNGRRMPGYEVHAGARMGDRSPRLGEPVGWIPAKIVPEFLDEALRRKALDSASLRDVVAEFEELPDPIPEDLFHDWRRERT